MNRLALIIVSLSLSLSACGAFVNSHEVGVPYDVDPQEFKQDFGQTTMAKFPSVSCPNGAGDCAGVPALQGATASCDAASKKCIATIVQRLPLPVNLSQQPGLPAEISNSSLIQDVQVTAVHYWAASNTVNVATPPINIYIGGQSAQKETDAGVKLLGTVPSIPAGKTTQCGTGAAGTKASGCPMTLSDEGKTLLGTLAKDIKTAFNVIAVVTLVVHAGDPLPGGAIDLFVQPTLTFQIPL